MMQVAWWEEAGHKKEGDGHSLWAPQAPQLGFIYNRSMEFKKKKEAVTVCETMRINLCVRDKIKWVID